MIRHTVVFRLKHPVGSPPEREFLAAAQEQLSSVPGVQAFERLRQVSRKNAFRFGFSMEFADQRAYDAYSNHPDHNRFVRERWIPEVEEFLEIDYEPYTGEA
jgi:heme-degrading monooxygenase HmoA